MSKRQDKLRRASTRRFSGSEIMDLAEARLLKDGHFAHERCPAPIKALTATQGLYLEALASSPQTVVMGPAGTGKTWVAATYAADLYRQRKVQRIVLTRPNVPGGRALGFLPGTLEEKFGPWAMPLVEAIEERIGKAAFEIALKNRDIEMVPFEVMRGRSWKGCFVLLDEAQNATAHEMKLFLTRIGEDSRVVINGDVSQCDLKETSGLKTILGLIQAHALPVPVIEFTLEDIVRSGICAMWARAFAAEAI